MFRQNRHSLKVLRSLRPSLSTVCALNSGQKRFQGGFTPSDMPIVKKKWIAAEKVGKMCESMKNVAAGALPGCERHLSHARPFGSVTKPMFEVTSTPQDVKRVVHLAIGTERGMCGAVSSNTVKAIDRFMKKNKGFEHKVVCYGKRSATVANTYFGESLLFAPGEVKTRVPTYEFACQLAEILLYDYEWDQLRIYYNEYENAVRFHARECEIYRSELAHAIAVLQFPAYEIEADEATLVDNLVEYKLATTLFTCLAENAASEQSARLASMDGATKNCNEMTQAYEKIYQGLRKSKITNELIILGAAAKLAKSKVRQA